MERETQQVAGAYDKPRDSPTVTRSSPTTERAGFLTREGQTDTLSVCEASPRDGSKAKTFEMESQNKK